MTTSVQARAGMLEYNATLLQRVDVTEKLAFFRVAPDPSDSFPGGRIPDFTPGQYAVLGLNNEASPALGKTARAYSIASPPEEKRYLEFYIRFVDQATSSNPLTHLLWRAEAGQRLHLKSKILGHFTIADTVGDDDPRLKIFVAAGTGLAPFHSISRSRLVSDRFRDRLALLHGASYPNELGYFDVLSRLERDSPRFAYLPTISRPQQAPNWGGSVGRVENFFAPERVAALEPRLGLTSDGLNPANAVIYICGLVGTIQETLRLCLRLGFVPENSRIRRALNLEDLPPSLFFEQYDTTPIIDLKDEAGLRALLAGTPFEARLDSQARA